MRSIGPQIWIEDQPWQVPLFGSFGQRMTIIRLRSGELMIISPVKLDQNRREELAKLGPVRYLIGPNSMHHLSLKSYQEAFPEAKMAAPAKLQEKRKDLQFQITLEDGKTDPWSDEVDMVLVNSKSKMSEAVFFHRASRTLILTDLLFNVPEPRTWTQKIAYSLNGMQKLPVMSRIGRKLFNDHQHLKEKVKSISKWDFDQVVVAHGEIIVKGGKAKFLESFQWLEG